MSRRGGASTIAGVNYQITFTALELARALWDDDFVSLQAEAFFISDINTDEEEAKFQSELGGVDDLIVTKKDRIVHYNIKIQSPGTSWNIKALKSEGVWKQFQDQYVRSPNVVLAFVTQSPIDKDLLECINRIKAIPPSYEIKNWLKSEKLIREYNSIVDCVPLVKGNVVDFIKCLEFNGGKIEKDIFSEIDRLSNGRFSKASELKFVLKESAFQWARNNRIINKKDIEKTLISEGILAVSMLSEQFLLDGFASVSAELESIPYTIGKSAAYINRLETNQVLDWIDKPLIENQAPLAVLVGSAGTGKSVILRDLLNKLSQRSIPVIALKADRLYSNSSASLLASIHDHGLQEDLIRALAKLGESNPSVIVLIDQLDALSQSLSINRSALESYMTLIEKLFKLPSIRIIISCRPFDLNTDPILQKFSNKFKIELKDLPNTEVERVLQEHGINYKDLSASLCDLLKNPLHLDIFCRLDVEPENLFLNNIQDLYSKLYDQKVLRFNNKYPNSKVKSYKLKELLDLMSLKMANQQVLNLPSLPFEEEFLDEYDLALSQGLLVKTGRKVQFFHQSFFDYLYARQFVTSGNSVSNYLLNIHQGLFIRSIIRQVFTFLREYDQTVFLNETKTILDGDFRFHIKLLTVQQLASILLPTEEEKAMVKYYLDSCSLYKDCFIEATRSKAWFIWLLDSGYLKKWALQEKIDSLSIPFNNLLWSIAVVEPDILLTHIEQLSKHFDADDFDSKKYHGWILFLARKSISSAYTEQFKSLTEYFLINDHGRYDLILHDRISIKPGWVLEQLYYEVARNNERKKLGRREGHYRIDIIKEIYKIDADATFKLSLELLNYWLEKHRYDKNPDLEDKYRIIVGDKKFSYFNPSDKETYSFHEAVYKLAVKHLSDLAQHDPISAFKFIEGWYNSSLETLLEIVCATLKANHLAFTMQIYELLIRPKFLQSAKEYTYLHFLFYSLIELSYDSFSYDQQASLNAVILEVRRDIYFNESKDEIKNGPPKLVHTWYGYETHGYLTAIPKSSLKQHYSAYKVFQELERRFGIYQVKRSRHLLSVTKTKSKSSISQISTEKLAPSNWLSAFKQHENPPNTYPWENFEAAWTSRFTEEVKQRPGEMISTIDLLLLDTQLSKRYLFAGVNELSNTEFDRNKLTDYVIHLVSIGEIPGVSEFSLVWLVKKCIVNGSLDSRLLHWLELVTRRHVSDQKDAESEDYLTDGINTTGGAAIDGLIRSYASDNFESIIYPLLDFIIENGSKPVRASTIFHIAYLLNETDQKSKVVEYFIKIIKYDFELLSHSEWSLQYLIHHDFESLATLFLEAQSEEKSYSSVIKILILAWLNDYSGSLDILEKYWKISDNTQYYAFSFVTRSYQKFSDSQKDKVRQMFIWFLDTNNDELSNSYDVFMSDLDVDDFEVFYPQLELYVKSIVGEGRSHFFYEYVRKCVRQYPMQCLSLIGEFYTHDLPGGNNNTLQKEPLEALLQVYNVLIEKSIGKEYFDKAMDIFDMMLQMPEYRVGANEALVLVDRY